MMLGIARRGSNAPSGRVVMTRDGKPPRVVFEGTLEHDARWHDVSLALDAGDTAPLELRVETLDAPSGLVVSEPAFIRSPDGLRPRNLILVSLDTVRADALGAYGHDALPTSPGLDALAARGTLFERCFAPAPWTTPSHMGLPTGIQPDALGLARVSYAPRIDATHTTLAELFRDAGYLTVAFTGGATMAASHGFSDGFYFQQEAYNQQRHWQRDLDTNVHLALDWLEAHRHEPLFLFFHTFEPHDPYIHQRFLSADVPLVDEARVSYLSGVAYTDDGLGRFLARLEALGVLDDSVIVVTSDHGDGFRMSPRNYHGKTLYDEVLHVPLILAGPGMPAGRRVAAQVPLIDVYATLAELFGLTGPSEIDSRSLMPLVRGETDASRPVHLCRISPQQERSPDGKTQLKRQLLGLRRDGFKYIVGEDGTREELYDLTADPDETRNLADVHGATTRAMRRDVIAQSERNTARAGADLAGTNRQLDADYAAKLRGLGYLDWHRAVLASRPGGRGSSRADRAGADGDMLQAPTAGRMTGRGSLRAVNGIAAADRPDGVVGATAETCGEPTCQLGPRAAAIPFTATGLGDASGTDARQTGPGACPRPRAHAEACRSRSESRVVACRARVLGTSADAWRWRPLVGQTRAVGRAARLDCVLRAAGLTIKAGLRMRARAGARSVTRLSGVRRGCLPAARSCERNRRRSRSRPVRESTAGLGGRTDDSVRSIGGGDSVYSAQRPAPGHPPDSRVTDRAPARARGGR